MKKILFSLALAAGFLTMGCDHPSAAKDAQTVTPENLKHILLKADAARHYIKVFDWLCEKRVLDLPIKAYTVRSLDLITAMGIPEIDTSLIKHNAIRLYLAYDSSDHMRSGFKLLILPVDSAIIVGDTSKWFSGYDVLLDSSGKAMPNGPKTLSITPYVLDLNAPCPNTCSTNSVVN
jgi:hypothetical protein